MSRNGSGTYSLPQSPFVAGTSISSSEVNSNFSDIASALTQSVSKDGQTTLTGPIKFAPGSVSAPGITFSDGTTSGLYHAGSGVVKVAGAGSNVAIFDPTAAGSGQSGALITYGNGAVLSPVGQVAMYAGSTAPAGWALCYGQAISRSSYPELYNTIGTTYGSGDGSTTYNLPDLRGRVIAGKDDMGGSAASRMTAAGGIDGTVLGAAGGSQTHTLTAAELAAHTHTGTTASGGVDHTHNFTQYDSQWSNSGSGGFATSPKVTVTRTDTTTGASAYLHTHTFTTASSGSGGAHTIMQPTLVMNAIIFVGR